MFGAARGRLAGRARALRGYEQDLSPDEWAAWIAAGRAGQRGARLAAYDRGVREIDPTRMQRAIRARALGPPRPDDSAAVTWRRTVDQQTRLAGATRVWVIAGLTVALTVLVTVVAVRSRLAGTDRAVLVVVSAGVVFAAAWWLPRRAIRALNADADAVAAVRRNYRRLARTNAVSGGWTLLQAVGLLGGPALVTAMAALLRS